jgi:hypothetical protein
VKVFFLKKKKKKVENYLSKRRFSINLFFKLTSIGTCLAEKKKKKKKAFFGKFG